MKKANNKTNNAAKNKSNGQNVKNKQGNSGNVKDCD